MPFQYLRSMFPETLVVFNLPKPFWFLPGHLVLEPCLLTDMVEFHCMVRLHLSAAVTAPIAIRTGSHSRGQLRSRNVLSILVSQLSKASQATAVTQHSVPRDSVIR